MIIKKIDHIGNAVKDLDKATKFFIDVLGLRPEKILELKEAKVKVAFFRVGATLIELVEPTDPTAAVAKFIAEKGEGLHHIALEVDDIEEALKVVKGKGVKLIDEKPKPGVYGSVAFLNPESTFGILLQFTEIH